MFGYFRRFIDSVIRKHDTDILTRATKIDFYDKNMVKYSDKAGHKFMVVTKEDNENYVFNTVGMDFHVVQHETIRELRQKAITDMKLTVEPYAYEVNEGERYREELIFPEVSFDVGEGDKVVMSMFITNGHGGSSACKLMVVPLSRGFIHLTIRRKGIYSHRHTKGINLTEMEDAFQKGVDYFLNEVKGFLCGLATKPMTIYEAKAFLNDCMPLEKDGKVVRKGFIANKYLEAITDRLDYHEEKIRNQWDMVNIISYVLSRDIDSIDVQEAAIEKMIQYLVEWSAAQANLLKEAA